MGREIGSGNPGNGNGQSESRKSLDDLLRLHEGRHTVSGPQPENVSKAAISGRLSWLWKISHWPVINSRNSK